jgi:iron(III) transport system permease protein
VLALSIRFLTIAVGSIEAGLSRVSPRVEEAARLLGLPSHRLLQVIHRPLARRAVAAAGLMVFVDCMKELPTTLLLRPLNGETLATLVYNQASRGSYEDGAIAALLIVLVGLFPIMHLMQSVQADTNGSEKHSLIK